jgi:hypothetical protein
MPYLALFLTTILAGRVVDMLRQRHVFSTIFLRKSGAGARRTWSSPVRLSSTWGPTPPPPR